MSKIKVVKVPKDKQHLWPSVMLVPLDEDPEYDDMRAWVFYFEATYGKDAGRRLVGKKAYLQWCIRGRSRHEEAYAKAEFIRRCEIQGIRFVYLFRIQRPPLAETVRFLKQFNAKLTAERQSKMAAA